MHPIERLRYVARSGTAPDRILVAESMPALAQFSSEPNALLVSLRQLIARQPDSPGLLCLAANMVNALDSLEAGYEVVDAFDADRTTDIAEAVAIAEAGGTDVIDSIASGPSEILCPLGTAAWIDSARAAGRSAIVVTPYGSRLPRLLWAAFKGRNHDPERHETIDLDRFDNVLSADGIAELTSWVPDCPDVAELAR